MLLQHFQRFPELLFIFDKISLPQYGLYCKQIISTKSAQYILLPQQKKPHTLPKIPGHSMQLFQSSTITLPTIHTAIYTRSFSRTFSIQKRLINIPLGNTTILGRKLHGILSGIPLLLIHRHMLRNGNLLP